MARKAKNSDDKALEIKKKKNFDEYNCQRCYKG